MIRIDATSIDELRVQFSARDWLADRRIASHPAIDTVTMCIGRSGWATGVELTQMLRRIADGTPSNPNHSVCPNCGHSF